MYLRKLTASQLHFVIPILQRRKGVGQNMDFKGSNGIRIRGEYSRDLSLLFRQLNSVFQEHL